MENIKDEVMKINEITLGDYVMFNGSIYQVEELSRKGWIHLSHNGVRVNMTTDYLLDELQPVPLERLHLTKNGFKAREETDDTEFYYYDCYEINVSFDEGLPEDDIPPVIFLTIEFAEKSLAMPIEYVHELQQAMRIMGCDKEIKL